MYIQEEINKLDCPKLISPGPYTVYLLVSPEGKRYIGKTSLPVEMRWKRGHGYRHNLQLTADIKRFGWDAFEKHIVITGVSGKSASYWEALAVAKYNTLVPVGYNLQGGGNKGYTSHSRRTRPIAQIDKRTGEVLRVWPSAAVAARALGIQSHHISEVANGTRRSTGGFIWRYADSIPNSEEVA